VNYKTTEWLPSLIATSKTLGKIPRSLGGNDTIDWLPVDVAANSIVELALSRVTYSELETHALHCFNLVNPHTSKWSEMVTAIQEYYSSKNGIIIQDVEFNEWLDDLMNIDIGEHGISAEEISRSYPALRLLGLFQDWNSKAGGSKFTLRFATESAVGRSKALAEARPVDAHMMGRWLSSWDF